jgi:hypothetical protein
VAVFAFFFEMSAGQIKADKTMVKTLSFKIYDPEIKAMVIAVTGSTFLAPDLGGRMVAFLRGDPRFQLNMAFQAFII